MIDALILFMITCSMEFGMGMITASVLDSMGAPDIDASAENQAYSCKIFYEGSLCGRNI